MGLPKPGITNVEGWVAVSVTGGGGKVGANAKG
jgi:hypothetical protein